MNKNELISLGEKILKNSNILSFRLDSEVILSNVLNITREKLEVLYQIRSIFFNQRKNK